MNLTGLLTGVGQAGSDVAQGKLDAQQAQLKDLFDKLGLKQGQVNLQESEERLRKLQGAPSNETEKFQQTMNAFKNIFKREPTEQEKGFLFGMPQAPAPKQITNKLEAWRDAFVPLTAMASTVKTVRLGKGIAQMARPPVLTALRVRLES